MGASGCFRHSVCPRATLFMLSNYRRICLTPHSLSDWECKLISTHRSIHGHTKHNETFASRFVRQRGGVQRVALSSALRKQVSLSLYIHLFSPSNVSLATRTLSNSTTIAGGRTAQRAESVRRRPHTSESPRQCHYTTMPITLSQRRSNQLNGSTLRIFTLRLIVCIGSHLHTC